MSHGLVNGNFLNFFLRDKIRFAVYNKRYKFSRLSFGAVMAEQGNQICRLVKFLEFFVQLRIIFLLLEFKLCFKFKVNMDKYCMYVSTTGVVYTSLYRYKIQIRRVTFASRSQRNTI